MVAMLEKVERVLIRIVPTNEIDAVELISN